jgi:sarcosine oxidase
MSKPSCRSCCGRTSYVRSWSARRGSRCSLRGCAEGSAALRVVRTPRAEYAASHLVVAAGSWTATLVPSLAALLVPERQVVAWLEIARPEHFSPPHMPVFNLAVEEGHFYGFPEFGRPGFKLGKYHHLRETVHPDGVDREVHDHDIAILRDFARRYFPDGAGPALSATVCLFTNTPDEHFIIDRLPDIHR